MLNANAIDMFDVLRNDWLTAPILKKKLIFLNKLTYWCW